MSDAPLIPNVDVKGLHKFLTMTFNARIPAMVYGAPGVGKSDIIEAFAASIDHACLDVRLGYMLPETVGPIYYPDVKGKATIPLCPAIIDQINKLHDATGKPVLVFLDEITTASSETNKAGLEFLLKGSIAGFRPKCPAYVVAAGNRPEDTPEAIYLPVPSRTRFFSVLFNPSLGDLARHIEKRLPCQLGQSVAAFLKTSEARRLAKRDTIADGIDPIFTPRGLFKAIECVSPEASRYASVSDALDDSTVAMLMCSAVGSEFFGRFQAHVTLTASMGNSEAIIANPSKAHRPPDPQAMNAQLQALSTFIDQNGYKTEHVAALMEYINHGVSPETVRVWAVSERAKLHEAIGSSMAGRAMLKDWGVVLGQNASAARKGR